MIEIPIRSIQARAEVLMLTIVSQPAFVSLACAPPTSKPWIDGWVDLQ